MKYNSELDAILAAKWHASNQETHDKLNAIEFERNMNRAHIMQLESEIKALRAGEFICKKCGLRKDAESAEKETPF